MFELHTQLKNLDISIAYIGLTSGVFEIVVSILLKLNQEFLGFGISIPCILYLYSLKRGSDSPNNCFSDFPLSKFLRNFSFIVFLLSFNFCVFQLEFCVFQRPLIYFITVTLAASTITFQILKLEKKYYMWILLEIILISVSLRSGVYFLFSGIYGFDTVHYINLIQDISLTAHIPSDYYNYYNKFFLMPLSVSIFNQVLGPNIKYSYFIIGLFEALSTLYMFFITKKLFNLRSGLLATLLLSISNQHICYGSWIIAMSLGMVLFIIMLMLVTESIITRSQLSKSLIVLFSFLTLFTHAISITATFILVTSMFFGTYLFKRIQNYLCDSGKIYCNRDLELDKKAYIVDFSTIIFVLISTVAYWMYSYSCNSTSFLSQVALSIKGTLEFSALGEVNSVTTVSEISKVSLFLNNTGYITLLIFAILGILISLSFYNIDSKKFALSFSILLFMIAIYIPSVFGFSALLPGRWFPYLYILLILFFPIGLFSFCSLFKSKFLKITVLLLIIAFTTFFMITSPIANPDNNLYSSEFRDNVGNFDSYTVMDNFVNKIPEPISKSGTFLIQNITESTPLDPEEPNTYLDHALIIRNRDMNKGFYIPYTHPGFGDYNLPTDSFRDKLVSRNLIYNNSYVWVYI